MSYRVTFSAIKGLKPNQILDYLNNQNYIFKDCFKFDYLPIITLSLNDSENGLNDFIFIYPIYFDSCKDLEINFETLHKNENDDIFTYIGNWDIPKLISKQFNVKAFSFEEWEGDFDFEIFENGITLYDFQSNYHLSAYSSIYSEELNNNENQLIKPSSSFQYSNDQIIDIFNSVFENIEKQSLDYFLNFIFDKKNKKNIKFNGFINSLNQSNKVEYNEESFETQFLETFLSSLGIYSDLMIDSHEIL